MTGIEEAFAAITASTAASSAAAAGTAAAGTAAAGTAAAGAAAAGTAAAGAAAAGTAAAGTAAAGAAAAGGSWLSLSSLGTYAALASAGISALSSIRSGQAQEAIGKSNAQNSRINAGSSLNASEAEAARIQRGTLAKLATAQNAFAGDGIQSDSGSALDVMGDMAAEGSLDTQIARWRGRSQSGAQIQQSTQQSAAADAALSAGYTGAGTTLLTSAANIANQRSFASALGRSGQSGAGI